MKKQLFLRIFCSVLLAGCAIAANAAVWYVRTTGNDGNAGNSWAQAFQTVQKALDVAVASDEIWVGAGTYYPDEGAGQTANNRNSSFHLLNGVALYGGFTGTETERDERDWETNVTILSGDINQSGSFIGNSYHVVTGSGTDASAVLNGFTVTGGNANGIADYNGGGMYNMGGSPTISHCIFSGNRAGVSSVVSGGGGMYNLNGSPTIISCTFSENTASATIPQGGGMYNQGGSPMISSCFFWGNNSVGNNAAYGGGMFNNASSPSISQCIFLENTTKGGNNPSFGGGMYNHMGTPTISFCTFTGNAATGGLSRGGGVYNSGSTATISDCTFTGNNSIFGGAMTNEGNAVLIISRCKFSDNSAFYGGGAIYNFVGSTAQITNCLFCHNSADNGSAILNSSAVNPVLINCTFANNTASAGSMLYSFNATISLTNCILWGNGSEISNAGTGTSIVNYSIVQGGYGGTNNKNENPLFADPTNGNFRLTVVSPAIDAGTADSAPATDLEGNARPIGAGYDMGAYEYDISCPAGNILYVNASAPNGGDGASWASAFTDLQDALGLAGNCPDVTEIWVAAGTYYPTAGADRTISFVMKNGVALYGGFPASGDPAFGDRDWEAYPTTLSGDIGTAGVHSDNSYHVVVSNGNDAATELNGFIITRGSAGGGTSEEQRGGGLCLTGSQMQLVNLLITENYAARRGGGMYSQDSNPVCNNVSISDNTSALFGGGLAADNATLSHLMITGNSAEWYGGGMVASGAGNYSDLIIADNTAMDASNTFGGGLAILDSDAHFERMTITGNSAKWGGGVYCSGAGGGSFYNSTVNENMAVMGGGGINIYHQTTRAFSRVVISGNTAGENGGGVLVNAFNAAEFVNVAITGNAAYRGGGVLVEDGSPTFKHATIVRNKATLYSGIYLDATYAYPSFRSCLVDLASVSFGNPHPYFPTSFWGFGDGNYFIAPEDRSNAPTTAGNYRLAGSGWFTDAGTSDGMPDEDLDGKPRPIGAGHDFGAYEYGIPCPVGNLLYVNASAPNGGDGASWASAFTDLQDALALANACPDVTEIWVAAGTYYPTADADRTISFVMKNGVGIYGGFNGTETDRDQRDWVANVTTLSGNIGAAGNSDNSYHVIFNNENGLDQTAVLDGFEITGGNANSDYPYSGGGGMFNIEASPSISNCIFYGNLAEFGGGMNNSSASPNVTNCSFDGNSASLYGGGMYNAGALAPNLIHCSFYGNSAGIGGGLANSASSPGIINCRFTGNTASSGGAMDNSGGSNPTITNSIFLNNLANTGGGIYNVGSDPTLTNCTFSGNSAGFYGGMRNVYSAPTVKNCIFWGNGGEEIESGGTTVSHSIVQGGYAGVNNLDEDPLFADPSNDDYRLTACSPAIDAGTNAGAPADDIDGNPRPFPGTAVDMGAYEFPGPASPLVANCQNATVYLGPQGVVSIDAADLDNGSIGCGTLEFSIDGEAGFPLDCGHIGQNMVDLAVTDGRGTATCSVIVTVVDDISPVVDCSGINAVHIAPPGQCAFTVSGHNSLRPEWDDNCEVTMTNNFNNSNNLNGAIFPVGGTTVVWTASDASNNSATCSVNITVVDDQLPAIACPNPVTVTCSANIPAINLNAVTAADNCGAPTKTHLGDATTNQTCTNRKTVTRTYRATDGSGNSATCSQAITVFDNVAPNFTSVPANVTVQCNSIPAVGNPTATDGCGGSVSIAYNGQTVTNQTCADGYTLTRQWMATDLCGNTKTATQRITVIDTQKPVFVSVPANITVQCDAIPDPATPTATDNCATVVAITYNGQTTANGSCPNAYTLTRRWTAADNCGNTVSISQRITVVDNGKPMFSDFPADATIACNETPPAVGTPTATDGCGSATVTYLGQTTANNSCPGTYQLRRTWRATDACGNSTVATQTIQVLDNTPPVFIFVPADVTIPCNTPLPSLQNPTASDACGGFVQITFLGNVPTGSGCAQDYTVTRTWRAQDLCGNTALATQVITVQGNSYDEPEPEALDHSRPMETRMMQIDQPEEKSAEIRVSSASSAFPSATLGIQPNPTTDRIWLDLTDFAGEAVTVSIHSELGQLIWENRIVAVEDLKLQVSLREAGAKAGIYTASVRSKGGVVAKRVVLVE